jgi:phosphoribosylanthranilate isomerase
MTWVKICGMTNLEDALTAVDAGADAVGFVFYEKSPRNISVEAAREIVQKLPQRVEKVGVFVDLESEQIREVVLRAGLSAVQLHGERSAESVGRDLASSPNCVGVSKVISVIHGEALKDDLLFGVTISNMFAILLDSRSNEAMGGTGTNFDWEATQGAVQQMSLTVPVIVAGGLTPMNVGGAIRMFQPFGVDVASGVEARPGKKDPKKVRAFVSAVREIDRKNS